MDSLSVFRLYNLNACSKGGPRVGLGSARHETSPNPHYRQQLDKENILCLHSDLRCVKTKHML